MTLKLLIVLGATLTFIQGGQADATVEDIVKDIGVILTTVKEGMPADYLETGVTDLVSNIKDFIHSSGVKVTEQQAQIVIDEVAHALEFGAEDIKNPLKFQFHSIAKAFRLLQGMSDKLEEIEKSGSTENLYETLVATEATCLAIVEAIKDIDDVIKVVDEVGGDDEKAQEEAQIARRKWCVGWRKRSLTDQTRDVDKRRWCVGWDRRSVGSPSDTPVKRRWCVGWKRSAEEKRDVDKRKWCVGWDRRSAGSPSDSLAKRRWCVGWKRGAEEQRDVDKRKWCVGWDRRSVVAQE